MICLIATETKLVVGGRSVNDDYVSDNLKFLVGAGYTNLVELEGGYEAWNEIYTPAGVRTEEAKKEVGHPGESRA